MMRTAAAAFAATVALLALAPAAGAQTSEWTEVASPIPPGGRIAAPLGYAGDIQFTAPNRGVISAAGNNAYPNGGLFTWDGGSWKQLATVCGSRGRLAGIALAGPTEFWTISPPERPARGGGLCHFKDGEIVGSYSSSMSERPHRPMAAAACLGPSDCWFAGNAANDSEGRGAFHLHWDGQRLNIVYGPQGRAVSALEVHQGVLYESTYVGLVPNESGGAVPTTPEDGYPRLLHRLENGNFVNVDAFRPAPQPGVSPAGTELLDLESDGTRLWAVGGTANSGPSRGQERPPLAAVMVGDTWQELTTWAQAAPTGRVISSVAPVPGTDTAWGVLRGVGAGYEPSGTPQPAELVFLDADGSSGAQLRAVTVRGREGLNRGNAVRVSCPTATDCWMVTDLGYPFRLGTDAYELDAGTAWANLVTFRPDEGAEAYIPDDPPEDDSAKFAPPPIEIAQPPAPVAKPAPTCQRIPALLSSVKRKVRKRTQLVVTFKLARGAKVRIVARRGKRVVARTKLRSLKAGKRTLRVRLSPRRWPTKIELDVRGPRPKPVTIPCPSQGGEAGTSNPDDTVTTR